MARTLTTYRRPSIRDLFAQAESIDAVAKLRAQVQAVVAAGKMDADATTRVSWHIAQWQRVVELMQAAPTGEALCYISCVSMSWWCPPEARAAIDQVFAARAKELPSPAERMHREGIVIVGVTG